MSAPVELFTTIAGFVAFAYVFLSAIMLSALAERIRHLRHEHEKDVATLREERSESTRVVTGQINDLWTEFRREQDHKRNTINAMAQRIDDISDAAERRNGRAKSDSSDTLGELKHE